MTNFDPNYLIITYRDFTQGRTQRGINGFIPRIAKIYTTINFTYEFRNVSVTLRVGSGLSGWAWLTHA